LKKEVMEMNGETKSLLDEEIERVRTELTTLYPGANGYQDATERMDKLFRLKIEEEKSRGETVAREQEARAKQEQLNDGKLDRWIGLGLGAAGILLPFLGNWYWMGKALRFEETGSFTSRAGQWVSGWFKPKR
jgi:hypothetical protein